MATNTASYNFYLPTVGGDTNVWGGYLNSNWDDIDDLLDGTTPVDGIDIDGGTIDGTPIGGTTPAAGDFTTLSADSFALSSGLTAEDDVIVKVASARVVLQRADGTEDGYFGAFNASDTVVILARNPANQAEYTYLTLKYDGTLLWDGNEIWHAGNDGSGSGLNADTVDDSHGSELMKNSSSGFSTTSAQTVAGILQGGFGAGASTGSGNWNDYTTSGGGRFLLRDSDTNGFGSSGSYYHCFCFEYNTKDGTGNVTQIAIPYNSGSASASSLWTRSRYQGTWTTWRRVGALYSDGIWARHQNSNGYIDIGPQNASYAHIYTDRPSFYFNKDVLASGNQLAAVYSGSSWNETNYPVGTMLFIDSGSQLDKNATVSIYTGSSASDRFNTAGTGSLLSGTWRVRGSQGGFTIAERVS